MARKNAALIWTSVVILAIAPSLGALHTHCGHHHELARPADAACDHHHSNADDQSAQVWESSYGHIDQLDPQCAICASLNGFAAAPDLHPQQLRFSPSSQWLGFDSQDGASRFRLGKYRSRAPPISLVAA